VGSPPAQGAGWTFFRQPFPCNSFLPFFFFSPFSVFAQRDHRPAY
jgi:hypothetical protein